MAEPLVLLADDEAFIRWNQERFLKEAGFRVLSAANGRECLSHFQQEGATQVAAVVLDYRMPVMDGIETFHRLREIDPAARIVMCSASLDEEQLQALLQQGASAVPKPFTREQFLGAIQKAVA